MVETKQRTINDVPFDIEDFYTTERLEATIPLREYIDKYFDEIVENVHCPKCFNYGKIWMCPPHEEDSRQIWEDFAAKYEKLDFIIVKINFNDKVRSESYDAEYLLNEIIPNSHIKETYKLIPELREREKEVNGEYIHAGPCILCPNGCTRPSGEPCRQPENTRRGWDELSTYVTTAAEHLTGVKLRYFNLQEGTVPEYTCVIAGLMYNDDE